MRKIIVAVVLALVLVASAAIPAFAATTQDVTVTATPAIVSISNSPTDWTMNDSGATTPGDDAIRKATTYYSNDNDNTAAPSATVLDGECRFTVTNDGTVAIDIAISMSDFTGGTDAMLNSDGGTPGAGEGVFGTEAYVSGELLSAAQAITVVGTADVITSLAAAGTKDWGLEIATQTDDFTDPTSTTSTVTLTATEV